MLLALFFFTGTSQAENTEALPYKISVLIFKHLPADKNTSAHLLDRWSENTFAESTFITHQTYDPTQPYLSTGQSNYDILLPPQQSALEGSYRALSHDSHYIILFNGAWVSQFQPNASRTFHFHKTLEDGGDILDGLMQVTMKFYFDIHFQTQLATPASTKIFSAYKIDALDELYQAPSNQLQYIDGPNYGALILITHYDGK